MSNDRSNTLQSKEAAFAMKLAKLADDAGQGIPPSDVALANAVTAGVEIFHARGDDGNARKAALRSAIEDDVAAFLALCDISFNPAQPLNAFRERSHEECLKDAAITIDHRTGEIVDD